MKENFYIFIDIDGVFYDWKYIRHQVSLGKFPKSESLRHFNPKSIKALNYLLNELDKQYNTKLVVSSTRRLFFEQTKQLLYKNGLKYDKEIYNTPFTQKPYSRGKEILSFLKSENAKNKNNVLIIDDERFDFDDYFSYNQIIKTNIKDDSLNMKHIEQYFNNKDNDDEFTL